PPCSTLFPYATLFRSLDWNELRGVLAHEISHIGNRDILIGSVAAAIAMGITLIANFLQFSAFFGGRDDEDANPLALLAMAFLARSEEHTSELQSRENL